MLSILHKGIHFSADLNETTLTGDLDADALLPYVLGLQAGRIANLDNLGKIQLCDGLVDTPIGFIINDAAGNSRENRPALASKKVPVSFGNALLTTDQIDTNITFVAGEPVYAGTGVKKGLVTNVPPIPDVAATGVLKTVLTITAAAGKRGNLTILLVTGGTKGSETLDESVAGHIDVSIESGVTTQADIKSILETSALITLVVAAVGATTVVVAGDATDTVLLTGGLDGGPRIGIAVNAASVSSPNLTILVG